MTGTRHRPPRSKTKSPKQMRGGDVILLHDGGHREMGADRSQTVIATNRLITDYLAEGYEFVTILQMMAEGRCLCRAGSLTRPRPEGPLLFVVRPNKPAALARRDRVKDPVRHKLCAIIPALQRKRLSPPRSSSEYLPPYVPRPGTRPRTAMEAGIPRCRA